MSEIRKLRKRKGVHWKVMGGEMFVLGAVVKSMLPAVTLGLQDLALGLVSLMRFDPTPPPCPGPFGCHSLPLVQICLWFWVCLGY